MGSGGILNLWECGGGRKRMPAVERNSSFMHLGDLNFLFLEDIKA